MHFMKGQSREVAEAIKIALADLAKLVLKDLQNAPGPVIQFCGPISTGGLSNADENLEYLSSVIEAAKEAGMLVFDQIEYERRLDEILGEKNGYDYPILDFFYKPILESRMVQGMVFLPLWEGSTGSQWEHDLARTLKIPIFYMENLLISELKEFYASLS